MGKTAKRSEISASPTESACDEYESAQTCVERLYAPCIDVVWETVGVPALRSGGGFHQRRHRSASCRVAGLVAVP